MEQEATSLKDRIQARNEIKEPRMFKVYVINDDVTDFDFVVKVLENSFGKSKGEAESIANETHNTGKGLAGIYSYDMAHTKVAKATQAARSHGFPLRFTIVAE